MGRTAIDSIKAAVRFVCVATLLVGSVVGAAEYPCPSDPGFCYRDLGDDGCFDSGTDLGPINSDIESAMTIPPGTPAPGSIVCPPSVKKLVATAVDIRLKTAVGSSILFYAAKIQGVRWVELISGERVLLGGQVSASSDVDVSAEDDVLVEKGMSLDFSSGGGSLVAESTGGDVIIGRKAKFRAAAATFSSVGGSVHAEQAVLKLLFAGELSIFAGQDVVLVRPRVTAKASLGVADISIQGQSVTIEDKAKITMTTAGGLPDLAITATSGDVEIERLIASVDAGVTISGANVSIGLPDGDGVVRPSRIAQKNRVLPIGISAADTLAIDSLRATVTDDVHLTTFGQAANVIKSTFKGKKATPTVTVSAGAGSTCDLTGTTVKSATLVTSCDNVVGP